jgi:selenophosphate synthetase-related protein
MTDVGLSTILISVEEKNIEKINEVAKSNKVFVVEFNKILEEE